MSTLFVTDPLHGLDAGIDSSVGLMAAAAAEDAAVWVCGAEDLAVVHGRLVARSSRITLRPRTARGDHRWIVDSPWSDEIEHRTVDVTAEIQMVLMRLDPPVDPRYLRTAYLLDIAVRHGVQVVNRPSGIRTVQEKLWVLGFDGLCPDTMVSAAPDDVLAFLAHHGTAVLKPVDGFAGIEVWLLRDRDPNVRSLVESATARGTRQVIAQEYLPDVLGGNKRLFVMDGEIIGAVDRFPTSDDFRIGPPSAPVEPDERDRHLVATLGPHLRRLGITIAGLDVIDGRLIEVNVTCPGGMHKTDALLGTDLSGTIMRRLLHPAKERILT